MRIEETYATIELGTMELELVITSHCYPAEPMVRFYRDGSGYPGAPAYAEIISVEVTRAYGEFGAVTRNNRGWFNDLDYLAFEYVDEHSEEFTNMVLENIVCEDY